MNDEVMKALEEDGKKLRGLTGEEHGPFCPRCLVNPLGEKPVFLGPEGHICDACWTIDRFEEEGQV
jgi:hypothetical protein